ncbi:tRNA (guanosine(46)-N7)-methyltransferase TrmB [Flaviflexus equikiangi]|uniref:tRNA (guanine-N(7)-)-methyltransferase n=1 Tax=Flaviflexus equikiangi TaxID=2758573 RepID=A0ABS2TEI4_9ACTO|nr:tRNA (guanosine(46)-N7)-methyltransferase TrmB [Flaviflexus equikiangi]MBM9432768.1 tRNA (guanosine(46)-N7)-methyltransferase TrmB [Flaviflexus equikiangi]
MTEKRHRRITSFVPRSGRIPERQERALRAHGATYIIDAEIDDTYVLTERPRLEESFGRQAPLIVEIGAGAGDQIVAHAKQHPENNYLALEVWWPGVASSVSRIVREGVDNVRLLNADAVVALPLLFGQGEKPVEVWTFFPDPWQKARHRKRRLVTPSFAQIVADILPTGGVWRLATDWDDYAWQMRDAIAAVPELVNPHAGQRIDEDDPGDEGIVGGFAPRWEGRITTRFETRGLGENRRIHDLEVYRG